MKYFIAKEYGTNKLISIFSVIITENSSKIYYQGNFQIVDILFLNMNLDWIKNIASNRIKTGLESDAYSASDLKDEQQVIISLFNDRIGF